MSYKKLLIVFIFLILQCNLLEANSAPVVTSTDITSIGIDTVYSYTLEASDDDNDTLTWEATSLPSWLDLNQTWQYVGSAGFGLGAATFYTDIKIARDGTIYVLYSDADNGDSATVMKYNDSNDSWSVVGSANFSLDAAYYTTLALDSNNTPYVAYADASSGENATVMKYSESTDSWDVVGSIGFSDDGADYLNLAIDSNDTLYVAYQDFDNSGKATVRKYNESNNSWDVVGTKGFTGNQAYYVQLAFDTSDTPYIAYKDKANNNKLSVMKYDSGSWVQVGAAGFSDVVAEDITIAFDSNNTPYVAYEDDTNKYLSVRKYSGSSWDLVGDANISGGETSSAQIIIDSSDTPYVVYQDTDNGSGATLMKYDGSAWSGVGDLSFGESSAKNTAIAFDNSYSPYVVFSDGKQDDKTTVMALTTQLLGTPTSSDVGDYDVNLTLSDGTTTITHDFSINVFDTNYLPTSADTSITIDEDQTYTFDGNEFAFDDNNSDDTLRAIYITVLPSQGNLQNNDVDITLNEKIEDITDITFIPASNANGTPYTSFEFVVNDGEANSTDTYTFTINVNAVEDTPTITSTPSSSIDEDSTYSYTFAANDGDDDQLTWGVSENTTLPSWLEFTRSWESVGESGFGDDEDIDLTSIVFDSNDTPYVAFREDTTQKLSVMKYTSSGWEYVGSSTFSTRAYSAELVIDSNDNLYVAYSDYNHYATVMRYKDDAWEALANVQDTDATYMQIAVDANDTLYIAFRDAANEGKATLMSYDDTNESWSAVGSAGFSTNAVQGMDLAIDSSGVPYLAYQDQGNEYYIGVMKYDGSEWVSVGSSEVSGMNSFYPSLAFDSIDTPYLSYADGENDYKANVKKYSDGSWVSVGSSNISDTKANDIQIAIDSDDTPYIVFVNELSNDNYATVMKYDGSEWVSTGDSISQGAVEYTTIAIDSQNNPYIFYKDENSSNKASVMRYVPSGITGVPTNDDVGANDVNLTLSDGTTTTEQNFQITVNQVNDAPTIISEAITSVDENSAYNYILEANDDEDDTLTWSVADGTTLPSWLSLTQKDSWEYLGDESGFSDDYTDEVTLAFDSNNTPYAAFIDGNASSKVTVMKYDGSTWSHVGSAGFSTNQSTYVRIEIASDDTPYVVYDDSVDGTIIMKRYSGSEWVSVGTPISSLDNSNFDIAIDSHDNIYIISRDYDNDQKATVMKYDGSDWVTVGSAGFSSALSAYHSIEIGSDDTPYVAFGRSASKLEYTAVVMKYDGSDWVYIGEDGFSTEGVSNTDLALDSSDTPYVTFTDKNNDSKAAVMKYDGGEWVYVGETGLSENMANNTNILFDSSDTPYLAYKDTTLNKTIVKKYNGLQWVSVAQDSLDEKADWSYLAKDSDDTIYLAYYKTDTVKAAVQKYIPSSLSGTPSSSDIGVYDINLTLSDGNTTVAYNFAITVSETNDAPTSANGSITMDEDRNYAFSSEEFAFSDIDGDSLSSIYITSLPSGGNFTLNDGTVTLNQEVTYANISGLIFSPSDNENGTPYTSFEFVVNDGETNSTSSYTMTINVTAVNDAPVMGKIANITIAEDENHTIQLSATDVENDTLTYSVALEDTNLAGVTLSGDTVTITPYSSGETLVTATVSDGVSEDVETFTLTVTAVEGEDITSTVDNGDGTSTTSVSNSSNATETTSVTYPNGSAIDVSNNGTDTAITFDDPAVAILVADSGTLEVNVTNSSDGTSNHVTVASLGADVNISDAKDTIITLPETLNSQGNTCNYTIAFEYESDVVTTYQYLNKGLDDEIVTTLIMKIPESSVEITEEHHVIHTANYANSLNEAFSVIGEVDCLGHVVVATTNSQDNNTTYVGMNIAGSTIAIEANGDISIANSYEDANNSEALIDITVHISGEDGNSSITKTTKDIQTQEILSSDTSHYLLGATLSVDTTGVSQVGVEVFPRAIALTVGDDITTITIDTSILDAYFSIVHDAVNYVIEILTTSGAKITIEPFLDATVKYILSINSIETTVYSEIAGADVTATDTGVTLTVDQPNSVEGEDYYQAYVTTDVDGVTTLAFKHLNSHGDDVAPEAAHTFSYKSVDGVTVSQKSGVMYMKTTTAVNGSIEF